MWCEFRSYHSTVHRTVYGGQKHPKALEPFLPELRTFCEHNHNDILHNILRCVNDLVRGAESGSPSRRLLATGMEIEEDTFVKMHGFDAVGDSHGTCIHLCKESRSIRGKTH